MVKASVPFAAFDNFSRNVDFGLGTATSGQPWAVDPKDQNQFRVNREFGIGVLESTSSTDNKPRVATLGMPTATQTQSILMSFVPRSWTAHADFGPVLLRHADNKYVLLRLRPGYGPGTVQVVVRNGDHLTALAPDPGSATLERADGSTGLIAGFGDAATGDGRELKYAFRKEEAYWCRFEYGAGQKQFRFRIWQAGEAEPRGWQATYSRGKSYTDADLPWAKGSQGVFVWQSSTFVVGLRTLYVYTSATEEYGADGMLPAVTGQRDYPLIDRFARRDFAGWGKAANGALWYGNVLDDPSNLTRNAQGWTEDGKAFLRFKSAYTKNGGLWAFMGNTDLAQTGEKTHRQKEVEVRFVTDDLTSDMVLRVGPRGLMGRHDDAISGIGYAVQIPLKASGTMRLVLKERLRDQAWTALTADNDDVVSQPLTLKSNTEYTARVQILPDGDGFQLNASVWETAKTAPTAFQLRYSNPTGTPKVRIGVPFVAVADSSDGGLFTLSFFSAKTTLTDTAAETGRSFTLTDYKLNDKTATGIDLTFNYTGTVSAQTDVTITYYATDTPQERRLLSSLFSATQDSVKVGPGSFRADTGMIDGLRPNTDYLFIAKMEEEGIPTATLTVQVRTNYDGIWIPSVDVAEVTHNQFLVIADMGSQVTAAAAANATAVVRYRPRSLIETLPWTTVQMQRVLRKGTDDFDGFGRRVFYRLIDGILPDTTYDYEVEVTDPDGVEGKSDVLTVTRSGSVTTFGRQPLLAWTNPDTGQADHPIEVRAEMSTARVRIHYRWDTEDEVAFELSYRETGGKTSTISRVYQNDSRRFRRDTSTVSNKFWEARLIGLTPGVDYEVTVVVRHPLGTLDGVTSYTRRFATRTANGPLDLRPKHYLFKVYSAEGRYLGTWPDVGEPKFSLNENGGVSDMTVKLPRPISDASTDATIALGNRVDVWVLDHTSDGIGRNLVLDTNFDLGAWATRTGWSIDPTGGIEDSACLRVNTSSRSNGALSDFIDMVNPTGEAVTYNVVVSVSPIIEQFQTKLSAQKPDFKQISAALKTRLSNIFPQRFLNQQEVRASLMPQINQITDPNTGLIRVAADKDNFRLLDSVELSFQTTDREMLRRVQQLAETAGCLVNVDEQVNVTTVPYVLQFAAKATTGTITAQIEYYDIVNPATGSITSAVSEEAVSTQGTNWEVLKLVFTPPMGTRQMRIRFTGQGSPVVGVVDKVQVLPQELLIYRGKVETIKTAIDDKGENIELEIMGLVSQLTDVYIRFKQWVDVQPLKDQPKWVDQSFAEDTAPPPTLTEETNKIKIRESASNPANRYAIVFPEITADYVIVRVYYDGDDNANAKCTIYYTGNMKTTFRDNYFTAVTAGQVVYPMNSIPLYDAQGNILRYINPDETLTSTEDNDNLSGFFGVTTSSGDTGFVNGGDVSDSAGSDTGGLGSVAGGAGPIGTRQ